MDVTDLVWIDQTGYNYLDFPSFLAWRIQGYQTIYGADVQLSPDTQDGQNIGLQAQADYDTAAYGATTYNSLSPVTAQGIGLSRIVKINGLERENSSNSTVELTIGGTAYTLLENCIALDALNQQWTIPTIAIPISGTVTTTATASSLNPQATALPNTITQIFTPTQGWQTVNNAAAATIGNSVEADPTLRKRQAVSTANPALTVLEGTVGAVANVAGVTAVQPYENDSESTDSNGLPAHSISLVVSGGLDSAVAQAIQIRKTPGTVTYGTTSVPTVDSNGVPITINFYRPTDAVIGVKITFQPLDSWIISNETVIAQAVATYINTMIKIGGNALNNSGGMGVSFSQLFGVAYATSAAGSFIIESIELSKNGGSFSEADITLLFNEEAVCDPTANVSFVQL